MLLWQIGLLKGKILQTMRSGEGCWMEEERGRRVEKRSIKLEGGGNKGEGKCANVLRE